MALIFVGFLVQIVGLAGLMGTCDPSLDALCLGLVVVGSAWFVAGAVLATVAPRTTERPDAP